MSDEQRGGLGKASLELTADLIPFEKNVKSGEHTAGGFKNTLEALAAVAKLADDALNSVKMRAGQAAETRTSLSSLLEGVRGVSDESRMAAHEIDRVRITKAQAAESDAAGDVIDHKLEDITDSANEARRALDRVRLRLDAMRLSGGGGGGRSGYGVGPFGAGYGRLGVIGTLATLGAAAAPGAAPGAAGLLAAIPGFAATGVGALGTLALAFDGVTKAIGGDKKAFDDLGPSAKRFVLTVRSLDGWVDKLRETAGAGLFPGLTKGLQAALSPGTVNVIEKAVSEFAHAIGQAGAMWGRYFGSPQFQQILGPLMAAGARNIGVLSDGFLKLFDALGVVARAAIPFTAWLTTALDKGAKLVDQWVRAKEASGGLSKGMNAAKTSLTLVWGLFKALLSVVGALGKALYPISKVVLKDITGALQTLATYIRQNQTGIRAFVTGGLDLLVSTVRIAWPIVKALASALGAVVKAIGGWKTAFAFILSGLLATRFLGVAQRVGGIGTAAGEAEGAVGGLRGMLLSLGSPEVLAAIAAAAAAYIAFRAFTASTVANPVEIGPQSINAVAKRDRGRYSAITSNPSRLSLAQQVNALRAKGLSDAQIKAQLEKGYSGASGRDLVVTQALVDSLLLTKYAYGQQQLTLPGKISALFAKASNLTGKPQWDAQAAADRAAIAYYDKLLTEKGANKTAILTARGQYVQDLASTLSMASTGGLFTSNPPFTKNVGTGGSKSVIPPAARIAEAHASADASKASTSTNATVIQRYLNLEIGQLQIAAKSIRTKYASATGTARAQLFSALTVVQNKIRSVRAQLAKLLKSDREAELKFAVSQAEEAAAAATEGSKAYEAAIAAEEKALKSLIAYEDKRAKNAKLGLAARQKAITTELSAQKTLKSLLKKTAVNAGQNEAQFLTLFRQIVGSYAPNAFPGAPTSTGKTDTHLYDIKNELRTQTPLLKKAVSKSMFPATEYGLALAGAV